MQTHVIADDALDIIKGLFEKRGLFRVQFQRINGPVA